MKIALAANRGWAILNSRRLLIERLLGAGHQVILLTTNDSHAQELVTAGAQLAPVVFGRGAVASLQDIRAAHAMRSIYAELGPDIAHHFHAKPILVGAMSGPAHAEHIVNTVTGLGRSFPEHGVAGFAARRLYGRAARVASVTVFQNSADRRQLESAGLLNGARHELIEGSGVDVSRFHPASSPSDETRVLMMCRLLHQKGVGEFIAAARRIQQRRGGSVTFELAGEWDPQHPDAISPGELDEMNHDGAVQFIGYCEDPPSWLAGASIFVCPSSYREGLPRVVLEAAASGVPVVGSDAPGIRDSVIHEHTGLLVPPRDVEDLADAIERLVRDRSLGARLGRAARQLAVERFDIEAITDQYLRIYADLGVEVA